MRATFETLESPTNWASFSSEAELSSSCSSKPHLIMSLSFRRTGDFPFVTVGFASAVNCWTISEIPSFFLYSPLKKPFAQVLEFTPKCCKVPPPNDVPYSRMAIPSPPATSSCNLPVFAALHMRPSVAGPPPTTNIFTVSAVYRWNRAIDKYILFYFNDNPRFQEYSEICNEMVK